MDRVVDYFESRDVFIQIQDVTQIANLEIYDWDAVFLLHTWEIEKAPEEVRALLEREADLGHVVFFTTSGAGDRYPKGVDGISGASIIDEIDDKSGQVIARINKLIGDHAGDMRH